MSNNILDDNPDEILDSKHPNILPGVRLLLSLVWLCFFAYVVFDINHIINENVMTMRTRPPIPIRLAFSQAVIAIAILVLLYSLSQNKKWANNALYVIWGVTALSLMIEIICMMWDKHHHFPYIVSVQHIVLVSISVNTTQAINSKETIHVQTD